jgi:hypothetical protein
VRYNFIRLQQEVGEIDIQYISTANQLADILTKPLPGWRFSLIRNTLGIRPV